MLRLNDKGSALLIALALLLLVAAAGIVTLDSANTDIGLSYNHLYESQAFYVAEAGATRAIATLRGDEAWREGFDQMGFGDGAFTVTLRDSSDDSALDDTVIVISTAEVAGCNSTVEYTLIPDVAHPFDYAMFAKNSLGIMNSFATDSYNSDSGTYATTQSAEAGDVASNGSITVSNGAYIGGNVATSLAGGADVHPGATVTGEVSDTAPEIDIPLVPQSEFDWAALHSVAPAGLSGSFSYDPGSMALESADTVVLNSGVYFFSSIILKNSASLQLAPGAEVTIYMSGDIEMKNSSEMNPSGNPGDLIIYSQGDFVLKNSGDIRAVFYNPEGAADLRNSGAYYGSIVAYDIIAHNSASFHYDRNLGEIERDGINGYKVVAWGEL